jgi:hypothetical protein
MQWKKTLAICLLGLAVVLLGLTTYAQVQRSYRDGSVWNVAFIKMKPGMESAYLSYLANDWKREQEAFKKDGLVLSYKVLATEAHGTADWNLLLMTEFRNMAALEANQQKMDDIGQKLFGSDENIRKGYQDRLEIREVMGERLAREIVLEPRQ